MKDNKLTDKQRLFVKLYLKYLNASKAYAEAYQCKEETAVVNASRMLTKANVQAAMRKEKEKFMTNADLSVEQIINELKIIAMSNPKRVAEKVLRGESLTEEEEKAIVSVDEFVKEEGTTMKVRCISDSARVKALELLGKHLIMFTDKIEHSGNVNISFDKDDKDL